MRFLPFEMERYQSLWENIVDYNLSESGIHPLQLNELISNGSFTKIMETPLGYNQTNGSHELRELIAATYISASAENILVTTGSSEANFLITLRLLEPGDEIVIMLPNYMQIWGIARSIGARVVPFNLKPTEKRWQVDWSEFDSAITPKTKLIAICHPNNPTGALLSEQEIEKICATAQKSGAWILSDEVYRGAEAEGVLSASFWGRYEKVIVSGGLSKAYGLPGLRIGWIVAPPALIEELWAYKDYTTICPNPISDRLAQLALQPEKRAYLLSRGRNIVKKNFAVLNAWMQKHPAVFECIPPQAGAITLIKHHLAMSSNELALKLRTEKSVLIIPGEQFLMDGYIRIGFGCPQDYLRSALQRMSQLIEKIPLFD
ncbi:MAG TPA: aminotransferase class I/II-fold pyridoxal phosphate-dependent enzyme [bacterium]|nr:aminotransferase class I/II-fold pyridoxal phosphate-dependent enzyme [bacterium]